MASFYSRLILLLSLLTISSAIHLAVKNEPSGKYCFVLDSAITGRIQYTNIEKQVVNYDFNINGTSVGITGKCFDVDRKLNASTETVSIHFLPNDITPEPAAKDQWTLHLTFSAPKDTVATPSFKLVDYRLKAILYPEFNATHPDNATDVVVHYYMPVGTSLEWGAADTHGFTCSKSNLPMTNSSYLDFASLKVLAFALLDTDQFPNTQLFEQCKLDVRTSDLVPIIVGACLAGLVIIVLVAYLIGRARAKRQGYASV